MYIKLAAPLKYYVRQFYYPLLSAQYPRESIIYTQVSVLFTFVNRYLIPA